MFAAIPLALLTLALSFTATARPIVKRGESDWATGYLESYDTYHTRYLALDCEDKHDTSFFDDCCHPLLATQSLSDRPGYCTPSSPSSSSGSATSTSAAATPTDTTDDDCSDDSSSSSDDSSSSSSSGSSNAAAAPSSSGSSDSSSSGSSDSGSSGSSSGGSSGIVGGGYGTYFYQNGVAGACGTVHSDSDNIIAIDIAYYGNTGDVSSWCGKSLTVKNTDNGKTVVATVADVCPSCDNAQSLDMSVGTFQSLADLSEGLIPIEWWEN